MKGQNVYVCWFFFCFYKFVRTEKRFVVFFVLWPGCDSVILPLFDRVDFPFFSFVLKIVAILRVRERDVALHEINVLLFLGGIWGKKTKYTNQF